MTDHKNYIVISYSKVQFLVAQVWIESCIYCQPMDILNSRKHSDFSPLISLGDSNQKSKPQLSIESLHSYITLVMDLNRWWKDLFRFEALATPEVVLMTPFSKIQPVHQQLILHQCEKLSLEKKSLPNYIGLKIRNSIAIQTIDPKEVVLMPNLLQKTFAQLGLDCVRCPNETSIQYRFNIDTLFQHIFSDSIANEYTQNIL